MDNGGAKLIGRAYREMLRKRQYEAGAQAARDGKADTECPYAVSSSSFDIWMRGYRETCKLCR